MNNVGGQDAHPTRKLTVCGTGILPVAEDGKMPDILILRRYEIAFQTVPI